MEKYTFGSPQAAAQRVVAAPSWGEYLEDLAHNWSGTSAALVLILPWSVVAGWLCYYWFFRRPAKMQRAALGPLLTFYTLLTDGATSGFDKALMSVFHPALFKGGHVEKGLLRAMARCLRATYGPVVSVPRETVALKRDGMQANCVALVNFERKRGVTCQLSWVRRLASVKGVEASEKQGIRTPGRMFTADEVVDGIGMAPLGSFHVTSFHVEETGRSRRAQQLDVLRYLEVEEFEPFAERFVECLLLERPPLAAVEMMVPPLREKHQADKAKALEESIRKVLRTCGGLGRRGCPTPNDVDATLTDQRVVKAAAPEGEKEATEGGAAAAAVTAIDGIEMTFHVACVSRNAEVYVRFTFSGMRCLVTRYEVRILPDELTQVVVNQDTGATTIIP